MRTHSFPASSLLATIGALVATGVSQINIARSCEKLTPYYERPAVTRRRSPRRRQRVVTAVDDLTGTALTTYQAALAKRDRRRKRNLEFQARGAFVTPRHRRIVIAAA